MRRLGKILGILGLAVGGLLGVAISLPIHLVGVSWLIGLGLAKLTFAAALGLIAGGAVLERLARRADERARLARPRHPGADSHIIT